jgi:hypothetical protein
MRRKRARGISCSSHRPLDQKSLAAAAAEVFIAPCSQRATRFLHPRFAAKTLERSRFRSRSNPGNDRGRCRTSSQVSLPQRGTATPGRQGRSSNKPLSPSTHARLGIARVVIGHHAIDSHLSGETLPRRLDHAHAVPHLLSASASAERGSSVPSRNTAYVQSPDGSAPSSWANADHLFDDGRDSGDERPGSP